MAAGSANAITVTAYDAYSNLATGYRGTVAVSSSDGQATLPSNYTFQASDNGSHNLNVTLKTDGTQSITATDTVTGSITGTQTGITVQSSPATKLVLTAGPTTATAGTCSAVYTVQAQDTYGNAVNVTSSVQVNLTGAGAGVFYSDSGCSSSVTNVTIAASSSAQSFYFKDTTAQSVTLAEADNAAVLTGTNIGVTVNAATATQLVISTHTCLREPLARRRTSLSRRRTSTATSPPAIATR